MALKDFILQLSGFFSLRPALLVLCLLSANPGWAQPVLRCLVEVNGEVHTHDFKPTQDPYLAPSVDIGERFRFKAVVLGTDEQVEVVNIYAYYQTKRQPMLLQHAKHLRPVPQSRPAPDALTGRVALYSPVLGKELAYQCALHRGTP